MQLPDLKEVEAYIREVAAQVGINPDIAVQVAKSEGLAPGIWQSNMVKDGVREPSYGPFQLYEGGGLGNKFKSMYGKSASDPSTWKQQVNFALNEAKKSGWTPWYGAKRVGIGPYEGIRNGATAGTIPTAEPARGPNRGLVQPPPTSYSAPQGPSFSPSQGPGEAVKPSLMSFLKGNAGDISDFGAMMGSAAPQQSAPPPIAAPTGFAPLEIPKTRYTKTAGGSQAVSLLRQLGLI